MDNNAGEDKRLKKAPTGISGFDEISRGGLPRARTTLIMGGPGSGKTVFALQTLYESARRGEPGIFVAFEEPPSSVLENAASFGWDMNTLQKSVYFLDARISPQVFKAGAFDLEGLLVSLDAKIKAMGARHLVLDSIDLLLSMLDNPLAERRELYRVRDWLSATDLTGIVTAREETGQWADYRYHFLQFMADCVVLLGSRTVNRVGLRELRIMKYRGSGFEENSVPFVIGRGGIEVASFGVGAEERHPVSSDRISTGIDRLDAMLDGGYFRGSSILVSGAPGTAKTTLAGSFAEAAGKRGEKTLYVGFDESWQEIVRNLSSVGIDLTPLINSGIVVMYSARTEARSADEHLLRVRALQQEHEPRCLIIDPLSALMKAGGEVVAFSAAERLLHSVKEMGITFLCTSFLSGTEAEASQIRFSTVADTWIHLTFLSQAGERNRALSIVKARGIAHSNQVRELILSDTGATLADVYTSEGAVLMGAMRTQKEAEDRLQRAQQEAELDRKRWELEFAEADINLRMKVLERELEAKRAELTMLRKEEEIREQARMARERELRKIRGAD